MDKRIRESIEACRPASDDLLAEDMADVARLVHDDAEVQQFYRRVQQWDDVIGQSLDDVPVLPGLAERILERLRVSERHEAIAPLGEVEVARPRRSGTWSRRSWIGAAVAALLSGVLVIAVSNWLGQDKELQLEELADQWHQRLGNDWKEMARADQSYAVPGAIRVEATRWQWVDRLTAVPVAAYELAHARAGQAMLYVARMKRTGLPSAPPEVPQSNTGGRAVAYWQSGDRVYVLVVEDERNYGEFVKPSSAPPLA